MIGHPFIPPEVLDEDFRDAFRKVPIVAATIAIVQHDVASLPLRVWRGRGDRRVEMERQDGNLVDLLRRANPRDSGYQLRVETVGALKSHGNAYWFLQRFPGSGREPRELWPLKPHLMQVEPGPKRGVNRYWYNRGGSRTEIAAEDIVHFRLYNPDDHPIGMSELEPVRKDYEAQFYALIWLKEFFRKGGMVAGVWSFKPKQGERRLDDKEITAIMARIKKLHTGYQKAWDPVFVDALEFVKRGLTLSEMEIDKHLAIMNANVCRAVGVPPWMVGIKEGSNLGTSGASVDLTIYTMGTLKRIATLIDTTINEQIAPLFGTDLEVETDFSGTPAMQATLLDQAKGLVGAAGRPIITVNEARRRLNLAEHEDETADDLYTRPAPTLGTVGDEDVEPQNPPRAAARTPAAPVRAMIDGNQERERLRRRAGSSLARAEARMTKFLTDRLAEQERVAIARLEARAEKSSARRGKAKKFAIDIEGLLDQEDPEDRERVKAMLADLLKARGREATAELRELVEIAEAVEINLNAERVVRFLDTQMDRAITVPDGTTAAALRESLQEGVAAGESLGDLTARVRSVFEARQSMAATIARTETLPGFNLASQETWIASGVVEEQEWLTARDSAVREAHAEADGQRVAIGAMFEVDGEFLEYPGDPSGSASNVINCRCTVVPIVSEEATSEKRWARFWHGNGERNGTAPRNRIARYMKAGR